LKVAAKQPLKWARAFLPTFSAEKVGRRKRRKHDFNSRNYKKAKREFFNFADSIDRVNSTQNNKNQMDSRLHGNDG